jgi:hypothetical protein
MIRKSALDRSGLNYGVIPEAIAAQLPEQLGGIGDEDYLLFGLLSLHGKVGNLDEILLDYRIHGKSLTALFSEKQNEQTQRIASALRTAYIQQSENRGAVSNVLKPLNREFDTSYKLQQIDAIARKMLHEFQHSVAQRRIDIQYRLQRAIAAKDQHGPLRRAFIGLSLIFNFASLRWIDLPILLRYVFGPKLADIYVKYFRLLSR